MLKTLHVGVNRKIAYNKALGESNLNLAITHNQIPMIVINDLDLHLNDFNTYSKKYKKLIRRKISFKEWVALKAYINRPKKEPVHVSQDDIRAMNDLYDKAHPYFIGYFVTPVLLRTRWAMHEGILKTDELDEIHRLWRKTC
ncbi:MAG: hypothetical protein V4576_04380 [Patescibacteria group bacterium]